MKLIDTFETLSSPAYLNYCFKKAALQKRSRWSIAKYATELETNIFELSDSLQNQTYKFGPYRSFYVTEPKKRLIESACFPDRVLHQAIFHRLEPWFDATFYEHSYACRTGRGSHSAMNQLKKWMRNHDLKYYLKCDIKKYFPSVDRKILLGILKKRIDDPLFIQLLEKLILDAPGTGIPIGNLTSQLFANIYLYELDLFVKRQLQVKYYIRYMDDFIILANSREEVDLFRSRIEDFLLKKLKLTLSPHKVRIGFIKNGISFVGFRIFAHKVRIRGQVLRRIRRKVLARLEAEPLPRKKFTGDLFELAELRGSPFHGSWCSFIGLMQHSENGLSLIEQTKNEILKRWQEKINANKELKEVNLYGL